MRRGAHNFVCLFEETVNIPERQRWVCGRSCIVALEEFIEYWSEVGHYSEWPSAESVTA